MRAKKSLGQNFLHSHAAIVKIRDAADVAADDVVLEVGPGTGTLTEDLLFFVGKVIAVEKDQRLVEPLKEKFAKEIAEGRLDLLEKDILEFDPELMRFYHEHAYKIVANIPYYITGALLEKFLSAPYQPEQMVLMLQKEVVDRIMARDKKESILSLSVKAYGTPHYKGKIGKGSFRPIPKVDSAILSIEDISRRKFDSTAHENRFFTLVRAGFAHKRKFVRSNLKGLVLEGAFESAQIRQKDRAEDLQLSQWLLLAQS